MLGPLLPALSGGPSTRQVPRLTCLRKFVGLPRASGLGTPTNINLDVVDVDVDVDVN